MASIEERIAYRQAEDMETERLRAFIKGIPNEIILDELRRRMTIKAEVEEMAAFLQKVIAPKE